MPGCVKGSQPAWLCCLGKQQWLHALLDAQQHSTETARNQPSHRSGRDAEERQLRLCAVSSHCGLNLSHYVTVTNTQAAFSCRLFRGTRRQQLQGQEPESSNLAVRGKSPRRKGELVENRVAEPGEINCPPSAAWGRTEPGHARVCRPGAALRPAIPGLWRWEALVFPVLLSTHRAEEWSVPWAGAMKPPRAACYCRGGIKMSWERASGKEASRMPAGLCSHAENPPPRRVENSGAMRAGQACGCPGDVLGSGQTHYGSPSQPFHHSP